MITKEELIRWASALQDDSTVAIDEGGLTLLCVEEQDVYIEVGGIPEQDQD